MALNNLWAGVCKYLLEFREWDEELDEGFKHLEEIAKKKGISLNDIMFDLIYKNQKIDDQKYLNTRN